MAAARASATLVERLERLSESSDCGCVPEYLSQAKEARRTARFANALGRAKALADENRLLAVSLLKRNGELCACEIQAATSLSHATVSHHMSVLVSAGIVAERRQGKWMYYRIRDPTGVSIP